MREFYIQEFPTFPAKKKKNGKLEFSGHKLPPIDPTTGQRLIHGNGCETFPNCFECPLAPDDKCKYQDKSWRE